MSRTAAAASDRRIPSLDGLRAISIIFVLAAHSSISAGFPAAVHSVLDIVDWGNTGVRVFFVISGFLITTLLMAELRKTGTVSIRRFVLRRTFRIFPAYYAFLGAMACATTLGWIVVPHDDFVRALTYTMNYGHRMTWWLGHAWSLSVEEQFYLIWPTALAVLGLRRGGMLALAFVLVAPVVRVALYQLYPPLHYEIFKRFETVGDAIAVGCLLAIWRDVLWANQRYRRFLEWRWAPLALFAVVLAGMAIHGRPRIDYVIGIPAKNVGLAMLIDWCLRNPAGRVGRVLNARALVYIGTLSYSIYLWQQPFLNPQFHFVWTRWPLNLVFVAIAAPLSYYAIEQPALRARHRIERWLDSRQRPEASAGLAVAPAAVASGSAAAD